MNTIDSDGIVDNRFKVVDSIGRGGMGTVLKVVDLNDGLEYALKYCPDNDDSMRLRFSREVRIMRSIDHQNVMSIIFHNDKYDPPYFVMPLAKSSNLIFSNGTSNLMNSLGFFMKICTGVQAIHTAGSTHRDIKPDNILIMSDGTVVISDLGLAKFDQRDSTILTQTMVVGLGTPLYCAPEQNIPGGSRDADARTDVFQLGKVLYELVTGDKPFLIDTKLIPIGLAHVVERATQQLPDRRYQSVAQLMDAVQSFIRAKQPAATPTSQFDLHLERAVALLEDSKYDAGNCEQVLESLIQLTENSVEYIENFEKIPDTLLTIMAEKNPQSLEKALEVYCHSVENEIAGYNFSHAEIVSRKMGTIFNGTSSPSIKILALRTTLVAAVQLGRYAAMDVFDSLLKMITSDEVAFPAAEMLREKSDLYFDMIGRVPDSQLHSVILRLNKDLYNQKMIDNLFQ